MSTDVWTHLDGLLHDAEDDQADRTFYTIAAGGGQDTDPSIEAQGRRAAKHAKRVRALRDIARAQRAALDFEIEEAAAELASLKHRRDCVEQWMLARSEWDRSCLREWYETAPMFADAKQKSHPLAYGLTIGSTSHKETTKIVLVNADGLRGMLPEECYTVKSSEAKAHLEARDGRVLVKGTGEVLPDDVATVQTTPAHKTFYLAEDGENGRIPLEASGNGSGDDAESAE